MIRHGQCTHGKEQHQARINVSFGTQQPLPLVKIVRKTYAHLPQHAPPHQNDAISASSRNPEQFWAWLALVDYCNLSALMATRFWMTLLP